jgi:uncharacterized protein
MSAKTQIVFIHGGDAPETKTEYYDLLRSIPFDPYAPERQSWRKWLAAATAPTHEFIYVAMPDKYNADYIAWSIWFDKVVPYLRDGAILIGHSLGGGFLLRYLSEKTLPVVVAQVHLVAPVVDTFECSPVGGFIIDLKTWSGFKSDISAVHLWHSSDDALVPLHHSERFNAVYTGAVLHTFTDRGHFLQPEFPELLSVIQTETVYA